MHIMACTMCLLIGSCWMFMTFAKEIRQEWETANRLSEVNQVKFKQHVHEFIEFHSSVKQLRKFQNISFLSKIFNERDFETQLCYFQIYCNLFGHLRTYNYMLLFVESFIYLWFSSDGRIGNS